jgi:hypothetical protein
MNGNSQLQTVVFRLMLASVRDVLRDQRKRSPDYAERESLAFTVDIREFLLYRHFDWIDRL